MMVHEPKNPACCSYKTQCTSGITHIDTLKSNFEIDQLEQQWPDMYCQHQNPDGVFNIGYTRKWFSNLFFESLESEYVQTTKLDDVLRLGLRRIAIANHDKFYSLAARNDIWSSFAFFFVTLLFIW